MKSIFDKLNLRPGERRLVVIVGIIVFVVLNITFVWPNFGAYAATKKTIQETKNKLARFKREVNNRPQYEQRLKELQDKGVFVAEENQALQLQRDVTSQATLSGVAISRYDPSSRAVSGRTNSFFDEASLLINFTTGEKELIDFLYRLGSGNSLIRVFSMNIGPEVPNRYKLQGGITLVESFQKKPLKPAPAAAPAAAPQKAAAPPPKPAPRAADTPKPPPASAAKPPAANTKTNAVRKPLIPGK